MEKRASVVKMGKCGPANSARSVPTDWSTIDGVVRLDVVPHGPHGLTYILHTYIFYCACFDKEKNGCWMYRGWVRGGRGRGGGEGWGGQRRCFDQYINRVWCACVGQLTPRPGQSARERRTPRPVAEPSPSNRVSTFPFRSVSCVVPDVCRSRRPAPGPVVSRPCPWPAGLCCRRPSRGVGCLRGTDWFRASHLNT